MTEEPGYQAVDTEGSQPRTAVAGKSADRSSRKWIRRRIEELDPNVDYTEIWALSYIYNITEFDLHWAYTIDNSHLGLTIWGADVSYRDGKGKMMVQAERRTADTQDHLLLWSEHGPDSPMTKHAIDVINKQHAYWAKPYPGSFSHTEDYIYLFAAAVAAEHTYKRSLGLPGWSENQKIAAHRFWCGIADLFTIESGEILTDVEPMPSTFEECAEYAEAYVQRPWPENLAIGLPFTEELIEQFLSAWFPQKALRPLGRALVTTFFAPTLFRIYRMEQPNPLLRSLVRNFARAKYIYRDYIRADEKEPITERRRHAALAAGNRASHIDNTVHRSVQKKVPGSGCPFHTPIN